MENHRRKRTSEISPKAPIPIATQPNKFTETVRRHSKLLQVDCIRHKHMALRRRTGRLKGPTTSQISSSAQDPNIHGFPALPDEIYIEIMSHIPSAPIHPSATPPLDLYTEIRRSRHETLLSLSQTSRSLRRVFLRYLWQRIEVRQGMKIGEDSVSEDTPYLGENTKDYNIELVRQLEIVTIRNPELAQYVNYLDVFIGEYSFVTVLAELARCMSMFSNLHTVQIDIDHNSKKSLDKIFSRTMKEYSYPQIRNLYIMKISQPLIASCPEARRVGFIRQWQVYMRSSASLQSYRDALFEHCPRLEVLENLPQLYCTADSCKRVVNTFPNLRTITVTPTAKAGPHINILNELNHLQTIILAWSPSRLGFSNGALDLLLEERATYLEGLKEGWIEMLKSVLLKVGLRDNMEKKLVIKDQSETEIIIKPTRVSKEA